MTSLEYKIHVTVGAVEIVLKSIRIKKSKPFTRMIGIIPEIKHTKLE
jgi:hypothetical protein